MVNYTVRWHGFQFRALVYIDGRKPDPTVFDLVKWEEHEPREVTNALTGEKEMSTENCFSIGQLRWNPHEEDFEFKSVGLRYFEYAEDGLNDWVMAFADMKRVEFREGYYD